MAASQRTEPQSDQERIEKRKKEEKSMYLKMIKWWKVKIFEWKWSPHRMVLLMAKQWIIEHLDHEKKKAFYVLSKLKMPSCVPNLLVFAQLNIKGRNDALSIYIKSVLYSFIHLAKVNISRNWKIWKSHTNFIRKSKCQRVAHWRYTQNTHRNQEMWNTHTEWARKKQKKINV